MPIVLTGCSYNQLNKYTPVLNLNSLDSCLLVSIPKKFCRYSLYQIMDLSSKSPREVNFFGKIQQDPDHPWLTIPLEILDVKSGKHTYKIVFYDSCTSSFESIFISYISQDDNPETPYIYMDNRGNINPADNSWKDGKYSDEFYEEMCKEYEATYGYDPRKFPNPL